MISENLSSQIREENESEKLEKLIDIEEFIARAKRFGVDFGKGDPKNRLRYYVKIGLLPHAQRKSFNGFPPNGAYPEKVLEVLLEIDKKLKVGKSIQEIKREKKKEKGKPIAKTYSGLDHLSEASSLHIKPASQFSFKKSISEFLKRSPSFSPIFKKACLFLLIIFSLSSLALFSINKITGEKPFSFLLASLFQLVQVPDDLDDFVREREIISLLPFIEPYLTINAETAINAPLKVKEKISAPSFALIRDELEGRISVASLTSEREYVFPDLSGTVCLTAGNCFGLAGEVITPGGTANRLAKFISAQEVRDSSIRDLYLAGVAISIDSAGRVGIGVENPVHALHVQGRIQATGDICTDLVGGRCLSTLPLGGGAPPAAAPVVTGIGGSGTANYLPVWAGATTLGDSILYQSNGNLSIGTTSALAALTVAGDGYFSGPLTIATSTLGQLILKYNDDNYLKFSINEEQSEISSSKIMLINSLTGQIKLGSDVTVFNAAGAEVRGRTFISTTTDATVRKSGELILRSSIPIFKFPVPAQTTSTAPVAVSKLISTSTLDVALPIPLAGTSRRFAFILNFADNIFSSASSTWLVDYSGSDNEFYFAGQEISLGDFEEGVAHMSQSFSPPQENWQLKVSVPSGRAIRVFSVFLLIYDRVND